MNNRVGQQWGNYRLERLLGRGGFAEVYLGSHIHLGTRVAVKVFSPRPEPSHSRQILEEASAYARLDHPHIIRMFEFGYEQEAPYVVMQYAPGGTLRQLHPRGSPLSLERVVYYVLQIAEALQYAHDLKFVHRDVKPENMLVGEHNTVLLGDFGIAIAAHETQSISEQPIAGTIHYMAPEQADGRARPASDQYALAAVIYEWICGVPPFTGRSFIEIALKHREAHPPSFQRRGTVLHTPDEYMIEQANAVIMRALAKDPHQRFPCVLDFALALAEVARCSYSPGTPGSTLLLYRGHACFVPTVRWSPNGRLLASGSEDATVQVWEAATGKARRTYLGHSRLVTGLAWSPSGEQIASASEDDTVQVWQAGTGKHLLTYRGHSDHVNAVAWSPDGRLLASSSWDKTVQVWNAETGALLHPYHGHDDGGHDVLGLAVLAWSPFNTWIASGGEDGTIQVWEVRTGRRVSTYRSHDGANAAVMTGQWSPDGTWMASASTEGGVQVWGAFSGDQRLTYRGHSKTVDCLAWSPDGKLLASGALDCEIQVWKADTGERTATYRGHSSPISALAWSPDGRRIASSGADGTILVWQVR